ncbi:hypothetical protein IPH92_00940 [Candidatus Kaiserbacteria bacterium]|nr:MAG: hypothetical protein IPH92_00940 [Candidatus Kaiserbacteria bacterium]
MKLIISVAFAILFVMGYVYYTDPSQASTVKGDKNRFVTTGQEYCKDHASLSTVLVESKSLLINKLNEKNELHESKSAEIVIMFLCKDEYIFVLAGPDDSKLSVFMIKPKETSVTKKNRLLM